MQTDQPSEGNGGNQPGESGGQSTLNWEQNYKNLQTTTNQKDQRIKQLELELSTARSENASLTARVKELEGEVKNAARTYETQLTEANSGKQTIEGQLSTVQQQLAEAQAELQKLQKKDAVRGVIAADYKQLLQDFEEGLLRDDLEGEALTAYLDKYKARQAAIAKAELEDTLSGVTPQTPPGSGATPDEKQLEDWVRNPANFNKPDWLEKRAMLLQLQDKKQ